MSKSVYYVWKDNFLEEYFALEKSEMENSPNLFKSLTHEKCVFHEVEANGFKEAINLHKDNLKQKLGQDIEKEEENSLHFSAINQTHNTKNVLH